jgi:predicted nucleic acid-binding protein
MDRVFLDANVLFSAAYRADSGLKRLWGLPGSNLLTSRYALEEARRNCEDRGQRERLEELVRELEVLRDPPLDRSLSELDPLPEKDRPILQAALAGRATHLLTGDRRAFGHLFGQEVRGMQVLKPAAYLAATPGDPEG